VMLKPGGDPFEVLVPPGQHAGLCHDLPDVMQAAGGRQFV
jgi:hypothetical protein